MSNAAAMVSEWRVVSPRPKNDSLERLEQALGMIREDQAIDSVLAVLGRYGIRPKKFREPKYSVSTEEHLPRGAKFLICGSATRDSFKVYEPGLRQREERGAHYLLTLLHVYFHEYIHMLEGEYESALKRMSVGGMRLHGSKRVSGYMTCLVLHLSKEYEIPKGMLVTNSLLNEGVTETIARECVVEYLERDPGYGGVTRTDIAEHRKLMDYDSDLVFYPTPVRFVAMLSQELQQALGTEHKVKRMLYSGYFKGTDVLRSRSWTKILKQCDLYGIMQACSGLLPSSAERLITMLHADMRNIGTHELRVVR